MHILRRHMLALGASLCFSKGSVLQHELGPRLAQRRVLLLKFPLFALQRGVELFGLLGLLLHVVRWASRSSFARCSSSFFDSRLAFASYISLRRHSIAGPRCSFSWHTASWSAWILARKEILSPALLHSRWQNE